MADLKTNYVDDVLDTTKNKLRKYKQIQNDDGTVSFVDVTEYTQVGTSFGAKDINDTNAAINDVNGKLHWKVASSWNDAINKAQNELQVLVRLSTGSQNTEYAFNISLSNNLSSRTYVRNRGYYQSSTYYSVVQISYNINTCICTTYNVSGIEYKNSTELVFLYR